MTPLHEMNPIGRFDDRAQDYVKYRPGYPAEAIDVILEGLGPAERLLAADVGAGTGISARLLGARGVRVTAVEPGAPMRAAAEPHPNVTWTAGTAEATGLQAQSVDLVLCAQSFHWFRAVDAFTEFARILKHGGRLAIMWNRRSTTDAFTVGFRQAIADVGGDSEVERAPFDPDGVARSGLFSAAIRSSTPSEQRVDLDGLVGRARSASYVPKTGPAGDTLLRLLSDLHARHADANGLVTLVYDTEIYLATRK